MEKQLGDKVEGAPGHRGRHRSARVQVSAPLNFEQVERTVESYDPDGAVLGTEQRSETTPEGDDGTGPGSQTMINNAYQNSKKLEGSSGRSGNINRLTVAVLVNQKALGTTAARRRSRAPCGTRSASTARAATGHHDGDAVRDRPGHRARDR